MPPGQNSRCFWAVKKSKTVFHPLRDDPGRPADDGKIIEHFRPDQIEQRIAQSLTSIQQRKKKAAGLLRESRRQPKLL